MAKLSWRRPLLNIQTHMRECFWNNRPSGQQPFDFTITFFWTNKLPVQWDSFQIIANNGEFYNLLIKWLGLVDLNCRLKSKNKMWWLWLPVLVELSVLCGQAEHAMSWLSPQKTSTMFLTLQTCLQNVQTRRSSVRNIHWFHSRLKLHHRLHRLTWTLGHKRVMWSWSDTFCWNVGQYEAFDAHKRERTCD